VNWAEVYIGRPISNRDLIEDIVQVAQAVHRGARNRSSTVTTSVDEKQEFYLRQFHAHEPRNGACPLCGTLLCEPRREARAVLDEAGVDLTRPSLSEAMLELHKADWRAHRDCGPDCMAARYAWQHLMACGEDPAEVS